MCGFGRLRAFSSLFVDGAGASKEEAREVGRNVASSCACM